MKKRVLLFFMIYLFKSSRAWDINKDPLRVTMKGSEITVDVPNESDLKSAFLSLELSDQCTVGFTFVNNINNSDTLVYKQNIENKLKPDDVVRLIGVFETNDQVIRKALDYKIDNKGNGIQQAIIQKPNGNECVCMPSQTMVSYRTQPCSGKLLFKEDFTGDMSKWTHEVRTLWYGEEAHREFVIYTNDNVTSQLQNGHLVLKAQWMGTKTDVLKLDGCTSKLERRRHIECGKLTRRLDILPFIKSAKVYTNSFHFQYGRVEIRARFSIGDWLLPYIILQPLHNDNAALESHIRVYARGNRKLQNKLANDIGAETVFGSTMLLQRKKYIEYRNVIDKIDSQNFHNYTIIWREDKIIFKFDGITYGTIANRKILDEINKTECTIALGLTAGGDLNFPDDYILSNKNSFTFKGVKAPSIFLEMMMTNSLKTWVKPNFEIDSVHVYSIHAQEE